MNRAPVLVSTRDAASPRRASAWHATVAALVAVTAAAFAAPAAHAGPPAGMMTVGMHGGMRGEMHGGLPGGLSERMLDAVKATAAQKAQIRSILEAARSDRETSATAMRALRDEGAALFAQPMIDAAAAEALRQKMNAQHELASRRTMQVMLDVGRVLTPEQRAELARRMKERGEMAMRHHAERSRMDGGPGMRQ